jgi:sugar-specific transcriptional regulator TrmB
MRQRCEQAMQALAKLKTPSEDERVYRLHTWDQVMERARQMIGRAEQVVLVSAFPGPLLAIQADLEAAAQRGLGVLLKIYAPADIPGVHIIRSYETPPLVERFPAQELSLVVDA